MAMPRKGHTNVSGTCLEGEAETLPQPPLPHNLEERSSNETKVTCPVLRKIKVVLGMDWRKNGNMEEKGEVDQAGGGAPRARGGREAASLVIPASLCCGYPRKCQFLISSCLLSYALLEFHLAAPFCWRLGEVDEKQGKERCRTKLSQRRGQGAGGQFQRARWQMGVWASKLFEERGFPQSEGKGGHEALYVGVLKEQLSPEAWNTWGLQVPTSHPHMQQ